MLAALQLLVAGICYACGLPILSLYLGFDDLMEIVPSVKLPDDNLCLFCVMFYFTPMYCVVWKA